MLKAVVLAIAGIAAIVLVSCGSPGPTSTPTSTPTTTTTTLVLTPTPTPTATSTPSPSPQTSPVATTGTAPLIDARKLFETNCALCHGPKRQGVANLGPDLTPQSLGRLSDADVSNTILKGRPNTVMTGWEGRLKAEEVQALVQLIKYSSP